MSAVNWLLQASCIVWFDLQNRCASPCEVLSRPTLLHMANAQPVRQVGPKNSSTATFTHMLLRVDVSQTGRQPAMTICFRLT